MKIILKKDVAGLGYKNEIVEVRPGYGRNFLIPNALAEIATASAVSRVAEDVSQAAHKAERIRTEAETLAASIGDLKVSIATKVGETGRIFGAVTALQVSEALKIKGFNVDRRKIALKEIPRHLGIYPVLLDLHKDVKHSIQIEVIAE